MGAAKGQLPLPKFWAAKKLSENLHLVRKCSFKNAKFGAETLHFYKFRRKIKN